MPQRIAVIGAGVLGLSVARSLAIQGAQVTVFDKSLPGSGTSQISYAWVNANGKSPQSYHHLNASAIDEHKRLQHESGLNAPWLLETGTWEWAADAFTLKQLELRAEKLAALKYPFRVVDRHSLLQALPEIQLDPRIQQAWHFSSECLIYPSLFIARLLADLREKNVDVCVNREVIALDETEDNVTLTLSDGQEWQGDHLVLATGRWSPELIGQLGLELDMTDANRADKTACSFLAHTNPLPIQLNSNIITPELNVRPDGGGRLMLQALDLDHHADPARPADVNGMIGIEMLRRLRRLFTNAQGARIERIEVGQRSRPADGLPALGFVTSAQRVYLMATHSGMTLAPLLGRLVADEIISGARSDMLTDFAPDRLLRPRSETKGSAAPAYLPAAQ